MPNTGYHDSPFGPNQRYLRIFRRKKDGRLLVKCACGCGEAIEIFPPHADETDDGRSMELGGVWAPLSEWVKLFKELGA